MYQLKGVIKRYRNYYIMRRALLILPRPVFADYCPYEIAHGFLWNRTQEDKEVIRQCSLINSSWIGKCLSCCSCC